MKILVIALLLPLFFQTTSNKTEGKISPELKALRDEYIAATQGYKESLKKLIPFYERDVARAEEKIEALKKLVAEGLASQSRVEESQQELQSARTKVEDTRRAIAAADDHITEVLNEATLRANYKQAVIERRKERKPRCARWSLTTYYRVNTNSVESGYRFVCR